MRLSEAVLLGSTMILPKKGWINGPPGAPGCAMAMACEAIGLRRDYVSLFRHFKFLNNHTQRPCRCTDHEKFEMVGTCIVHLFDTHVRFTPSQQLAEEWTVELIAQWLSRIEDEMSGDEAKPLPEPAKCEIRGAVNQPSREPVEVLV